MSIKSKIKDALIQRGSAVLSTLISAVIAFCYASKLWSVDYIGDKLCAKFLTLLDTIKCSFFSCCFEKSKAEKLLDLADIRRRLEHDAKY